MQHPADPTGRSAEHTGIARRIGRWGRGLALLQSAGSQSGRRLYVLFVVRSVAHYQQRGSALRTVRQLPTWEHEIGIQVTAAMANH
jgi:hypothetical protein